jgi:L-amino acid N-acyltransferase YncA
VNNLIVRDAQVGDAERIAPIYNHYITGTYATFETEPVSVNEMGERISAIADDGYPFLVCESSEAGVIGYAYANRWKNRCAYSSTVETTVYLDSEFTGRGAGTLLMSRLIELIREGGYHAAIAGIALPNPASVALHQRLGFSQVAHFRETGYKQNRWIDVGYWELLVAENNSTSL